MKKQLCKYKIDNKSAMASLPAEKDLKLRWYKSELSWTITPFDRPDKSLEEADPPECSCLILIATILLRRKGHRVIIYRKESAAENLLYVLRGTLMKGDKVLMHRGEPNSCHKNVSRLWMANPKKYRIVSGFAMEPKYKMWIPHSWLVDKKDRIHVTIFPLSLYFGGIMSDAAAKEFVRRNLTNK